MTEKIDDVEPFMVNVEEVRDRRRDRGVKSEPTHEMSELLGGEYARDQDYQLIRWSVRAFVRSGGVQPCSALSRVVKCPAHGRRYVILKNVDGLLALYYELPSGRLQRSELLG